MSTTMTIKNVSGKAGFFGYGDPAFYLEANESKAGLPYSLAASDQFEKDLEAGIIEVTAGSPLLNFTNASAIRRYFGYGPGGQVLAHDGTLNSQVPVDSGLPGVQGIADNPYLIADLAAGTVGNAATITIAAVTNGTVSPAAGVHAVQMGDDVMVTMTPSAHYHMATLTVDSVSQAVNAVHHFENIKANHTLAATFTIDTYTVLFALGTGTRLGGGALSQTINYNASATAPTITPASHKQFKAWSAAFANVTANLTVTASYDNVWYLAYTAAAHGTLTGTAAQTVIAGASGTAVTAVADTGYHFTAWDDESLDNPRTDAAVSADISVEAAFAINTYVLTYSAAAHGSLTGTTPQTVNHGGSGSQVTAVPAEGYHFTAWGDAVLTAARTDANVTSALTVSAAFAINTYTLTYTAGDHGSVVGTTPQTVNHGSSGTEVTATPDAHYHFTSWGDAVLTAARTDANVVATMSVAASFAIDTYTLTYTAGSNGSVTGTSPQTVDYAASGTEVTAVPAEGYVFEKWSDDVMTAARTDLAVAANIAVTATFVSA